jgi:hypothetical protein
MRRSHLLSLFASTLLWACTGPTGPSGPSGATGPSGGNGGNASCVGVAAPVVTGVEVAPGPYYVGRPYAVTVTATGGGTRTFDHAGSGAVFAGTGATQTLTPTEPSGQLNFVVLVSNGCQVDLAAYGVGPVTVAKTIWVSASTSHGAFGATAAEALATADQRCLTDAAKPAYVTAAKALIGSSLRATTAGWVLAPSTTYARPDGAVVGTTTAGAVFPFLDATTGLTSAIDEFAFTVHTGLAADWSVDGAANCGDWTDGATLLGATGSANQKGTEAIADGTVACSVATSYLYCVEQ